GRSDGGFRRHDGAARGRVPVRAARPRTRADRRGLERRVSGGAPDRVLITEAVHAGLEPLGRRLTVELCPGLWADRRALLDQVRGCAGLVVRNQTRVDAEL